MQSKIVVIAAEDLSAPDMSLEEGIRCEQEEIQGFDDTGEEVATIAAIQDTLTAMSENPEQATQIAVEHFMTVLGLDKTMAMESIGNGSLALNDRITNVLTIAQEGVLDRFISTIDLSLTSEKSMIARTSLAANNIKAKGSKEGTIENPGWGRIFTVPGKNALNAANVQAAVNNYTKTLGSSSFLKLVSEVIAMFNDVEQEQSKSVFIANDDAVERIAALTDEATRMYGDFEKIVNLASTKKNDNSFAPASPEAAEKIMEGVRTLLLDKSAESKLKELKAATNRLQMKAYGHSRIRVAGYLAADQRKIMAFTVKTGNIISVIAKVLHNKNKVCYSAIKYVEASTA